MLRILVLAVVFMTMFGCAPKKVSRISQPDKVAKTQENQPAKAETALATEDFWIDSTTQSNKIVVSQFSSGVNSGEWAQVSRTGDSSETKLDPEIKTFTPKELLLDFYIRPDLVNKTVSATLHYLEYSSDAQKLVKKSAVIEGVFEDNWRNTGYFIAHMTAKPNYTYLEKTYLFLSRCESPDECDPLTFEVHYRDQNNKPQFIARTYRTEQQIKAVKEQNDKARSECNPDDDCEIYDDEFREVRPALPEQALKDLVDVLEAKAFEYTDNEVVNAEPTKTNLSDSEVPAQKEPKATATKTPEQKQPAVAKASTPIPTPETKPVTKPETRTVKLIEIKTSPEVEPSTGTKTLTTAFWALNPVNVINLVFNELGKLKAIWPKELMPQLLTEVDSTARQSKSILDVKGTISVGKYTSGKLRTLADDEEQSKISLPYEACDHNENGTQGNEYYGPKALINVFKKSCELMSIDSPDSETPKVVFNRITKKNGGNRNQGSSHQNGLSVDFRFRYSSTEADILNFWRFVNLVQAFSSYNGQNYFLDPNKDDAGAPAVQFIFLSTGLRSKLCKAIKKHRGIENLTENERYLLFAIIPRSDHDDHAHVSFACPKSNRVSEDSLNKNDRCIPTTVLPAWNNNKKTGCEADWGVK